MSRTEPRLSSPVSCNHCGNVAPMKIVACYSDVNMHEDGPHSWESGDIYELLLCPACNSVNLRAYFWHEGMDSEEDVTFRTLFPTPSRLPLGLPEEIKKAYEAALKVRTIDPNAFGVLIGRTIEMVCVDREASGRFLSDKLKSLADKGEIPEKLARIASALTKLRNVGAHAELGELTAEEVPILDDLCRAVLNYVYNAPFLAQKAEDALNALKEKREQK
jgi:hypothetical protein